MANEEKREDLTVQIDRGEPAVDPHVGPDSEVNPEESTETPKTDADVPVAAALEAEPQAGRRNTFAAFAARFKQTPRSKREQKSGDRVRGLVILAGTTAACLFLFLGLFTTDSASSKKERRTQPSLGRPQTTTATPESAGRSVVPQLNVDQQPNEHTGELTEKDLLGTMRNRGSEVAPPKQPPQGQVTRDPKYALSNLNFEDAALAEAYRRQGLVPPPRRQTEVTAWNTDVPQGEPKPAPLPATKQGEELRKSSVVFVRTSAAGATGHLSPVIQRKPAALLPQGTKLVARLQNAVSSAAKVPVVAVIEYNYEHNGELIVPADSKAYGELAQATPQGWVSIKFDTIEFPNGEQEKISGSALSMDQGILRGYVNGKNTGKKFLVRAMTGIGTIAAFAVGGRGLGGQIDNSILLRERLASNVAMAGEQELAMLAYQQNIVITVPANTRFYLVLHEAAVEKAGSSVQDAVTPEPGQRLPGGAERQASNAAGLSQQELREIMQIRDELREMSRLLNTQRAESPQPDR